MIFEPQDYMFIFQDAVYSLAVGFVAGFINRLLSAVIRKSKAGLFIKDLFMCIMFSVLIFSYAVSFANYKVLRWYNVAAALAGFLLFVPSVGATATILADFTAVTAVYALSSVAEAVCYSIKKRRAVFFEKKQKITQKNDRELLKQKDIILYN